MTKINITSRSREDRFLTFSDLQYGDFFYLRNKAVAHSLYQKIDYPSNCNSAIHVETGNMLIDIELDTKVTRVSKMSITVEEVE